MKPNSDPTIDFYEENAEEFQANTIHLDMEALYQPFLHHVKPGSRILDAGCGPGRDAAKFVDKGFMVEAFDASERFCEMARKRSGAPVHLLRFQAVTWEESFEGIWASASLLHVPEKEMDDVIGRLARALVPDGVLYVSFKQGSSDSMRSGRLFCDYDEDRFEQLVARQPNLEIASRWITHDLRPGRESEEWLNAVLRRKPTVIVDLSKSY